MPAQGESKQHARSRGSFSSSYLPQEASNLVKERFRNPPFQVFLPVLLTAIYNAE